MKEIPLLAALLALSNTCTVNGLYCLECRDAISPRHCHTVKRCYPGEVCYVEKEQTINGLDTYNMGCYSPQICNSTRSGTNCIECCTTDACNMLGCNHQGHPQNLGLLCFGCQQTLNPSLCDRITECTLDQICHLKEIHEYGDVYYSSGCANKHVCSDKLPDIFGRRSSELCQQCCSSDLCNNGCYSTTSVPSTTATTTEATSMTTHIKTQTTRITTPSNPTTPTPTTPTPTIPTPTIPTPTTPAPTIPTPTIPTPTTPNPTTPAPTTIQMTTHAQLYIDCLEIYQHHQTSSGVYTIHPWGLLDRSADVYCDMDTQGGGWTVIQKRLDGSLNFDRVWNDYKHGFGQADSEYWLGNDAISKLTTANNSSLLVLITLNNGRTLYETYYNFAVSGENDRYRLHLGGTATGTLGDGLLNVTDSSQLNGMAFSTLDRDNSNHCARSWRGGWWFNRCYSAFLNGPYHTTRWPWHPAIDSSSVISRTSMMIRRN
ncbi:angiopoietin-related protein 1-like [Ostrea edulis]|uniref:angiopoietin-related protein 1-like n=1 Tax=Ostrea edulis TaxID=37623 RepID=UPI0024AED4B1|nr:angiopoietin-related protein 1-like [Ostrea edulis]